MTHTAPQPATREAFRLSRRWALLLCLISGAAQAQVPANQFDYTRTQSFTYQLDGSLQTATVEPGNAPSCKATTYSYDSFGNATSTTAANCAGAAAKDLFASRTDTVTYAAVPSQNIIVNGANVAVAIPAGLVATSAQNALSQSESRQYDPRFGALTQLTGPNALTTTVTLDDFGRKIKELSADNTSSVTLYCVLTGIGLDTSSNSTGCPTPAAGEAPAYAVQFTHSEARDASNIKAGPYTRVYVDKLGRQIRTATESFDGPSQTAGRSGVAVVADIVYDQNGAKIIETKPYFLASGSPATAGSNNAGATRYVYDELGRTSIIYSTDPNGSSSQSFGSFGVRTVATTSFSYVGLATTTTNDKGQKRTEEKSARGDILRVTDHTGAQIAYQPDAFGNVIKTLDALQNSITNIYDLRGLKLQMNDPDKGVIAYCYDALGQVKAQQTSTMRGGNTPGACPNNNDSALTATKVTGWTTTAYDKLGRATQRAEAEIVSTWTYDTYVGGGVCNKGIGKLCESRTDTGVNKKIVYDNYARMINTRSDVTDGPSFLTAVAYDAATGRLASRTYPTGLQVAYNYTGRGYLQNLTLKTAAVISPLPNAQGQTAGGTTLAANTVLWQANTVDAAGRAETEKFSNNIINTTTYDAATGRITKITAGATPSTAALNHEYLWDSINNLTNRTDANGDGISGAVSESFGFDNLNRLSQYTVSAPAIALNSRSVNLSYNALGMMLYKSDVGNYTYGVNGAGAVRPHTLQNVTGLTSVNYTPDLNGNIVAASGGKYTALTYTSFDNVLTASGAAGQYAWQYDENHTRVKETRVSGGNTRTTWYLHPDNVGGLGFESEVNSSPASQSNRHYLSVGGRAIGLLISTGSLPVVGAAQTAPAVLASMNFNKLEYWNKDHLGSIAVTTDHLGGVTQRYSYDPFGKRRFATGVYDAANDPSLVVDWKTDRNYGTDRGFTGHEELDDIGLVNMNGRLYDDTNGVFIQADPHVTDPLNLQNYNRYGYVLNNPLNATDPSGFDGTDDNDTPKCGRGSANNCGVSYPNGNPNQPQGGGSNTVAGGSANTDSTSGGQNTYSAATGSGVDKAENAANSENGLWKRALDWLSAGNRETECSKLGCIHQGTLEATAVRSNTGDPVKDAVNDMNSRMAVTILNAGVKVASLWKNLTLFGLGGSMESGRAIVAAAGPRSIIFTEAQLIRKYSQHGKEFGLTGGNPNAASILSKFSNAIQGHVASPNTRVIEGTYRGTLNVVHHVNPQTGLSVMRSPDGVFISVFKLNREQLGNVLTRGAL